MFSGSTVGRCTRCVPEPYCTARVLRQCVWNPAFCIALLQTCRALQCVTKSVFEGAIIATQDHFQRK